MAVGEERQTQKHRRKMPSFSSSLLDAIYHSIDDPLHHQPPPPPHPHRRNAVDEEIESLRRAIMIEKWMENHTATAAATRHLPSTSASSTDSSSCIFTSSETDSSTPKTAPFPFPVQKPKQQEREGRFTRTKSRALKIYGDLKKVKEPISPGGRIANFLNSIFSPRNLKKENIHPHPHSHPAVRKSRSMKDSTAAASRSCLTKNTTTNSSRNNTKSKRSVRFCPVSVILDENRRIYDDVSMAAAAEVVGSRFIKKNIDSIRLYEINHDDHIQRDFDDKSCASSDLFELENFGAYEAELPVYETTNLRMNRAIAFASRD